MFRRRRGGREADPRSVGYEGRGGRLSRFRRRREGTPEAAAERRGCGCCSSIFVLALAVGVVGVVLIA